MKKYFSLDEENEIIPSLSTKNMSLVKKYYFNVFIII